MHFASHQILCMKCLPWVDAQHFSSLLFLEIFCGAGGLTANVRALGIQGVGIDSSVSTSCKCPVVKLDLTQETGKCLLWEVLKRPNLCGQQAREILRSEGPSPVPLRSDSCPDGLPSLRGLDRKRVRSAIAFTALQVKCCVFA